MPVENDIGQGKFTVQKQEDFRGLVNMHVKIVNSLFTRNREEPPYFYIDMNAGRGRYNGVTGSPLIFLDEARSAKIPYMASFFETNSDNAKALSDEVIDDPCVQVFNEHHDSVVKKPVIFGDHPSPFGLLYSDPNGGPPPWDTMRKFFSNKNNRSIDALVYLSGAGIKRTARAWGSCPRLCDGMEIVGKKAWLVREFVGKHQWTFVIGTNWGGFPDWERRGFFSTESGRGKYLIERLHKTSEEFNQGHEPYVQQMRFSFG